MKIFTYEEQMDQVTRFFNKLHTLTNKQFERISLMYDDEFGQLEFVSVSYLDISFILQLKPITNDGVTTPSITLTMDRNTIDYIRYESWDVYPGLVNEEIADRLFKQFIETLGK